MSVFLVHTSRGIRDNDTVIAMTPARQPCENECAPSAWADMGACSHKVLEYKRGEEGVRILLGETPGLKWMDR